MSEERTKLAEPSGSANPRYCRVCWRMEAAHYRAIKDHGWTHGFHAADALDLILNDKDLARRALDSE